MSSKSDQAALLAQELASERSWANDFVSTPTSSNVPPSPLAASSISDVKHQQIPQDKPPAYEDVPRDGAIELPADVPTTSLAPLAPITSTTESVESTSLTAQLDPTRCFTRHEPYGSISGVFTVLDYLELTTNCGSITITLDPRPGDTPVYLRLTAIRGAITVKLSDQYLQQLTQSGKMTRPWDVRIRAKTGAVDAKLPVGLGSKHFLKSRWGAVTSTFYVADPGQSDTSSDVQVETHSGAQNIKFVSLQGGSPVTNIGGDFHAKVHGAIKVAYPNTWEGRIHAKTARGKVKVEGLNLQLQQYGLRELHASRGVAQQTTLVRCDGNGKAKVEC